MVDVAEPLRGGASERISAFEFTPRPEGLVRMDDPDGIYWFVNPRREAQLIVVGAMPAAPGRIVEAFGRFCGVAYRLCHIGTLGGPKRYEQKRLDRGFIDLWLEPL